MDDVYTMTYTEFEDKLANTNDIELLKDYIEKLKNINNPAQYESLNEEIEYNIVLPRGMHYLSSQYSFIQPYQTSKPAFRRILNSEDNVIYRIADGEGVITPLSIPKTTFDEETLIEPAQENFKVATYNSQMSKKPMPNMPIAA